MTGIVHSHPDATTQPSELDKAQCDVLGVPWYIVSWPEGICGLFSHAVSSHYLGDLLCSGLLTAGAGNELVQAGAWH